MIEFVCILVIILVLGFGAALLFGPTGKRLRPTHVITVTSSGSGVGRKELEITEDGYYQIKHNNEYGGAYYFCKGDVIELIISDDFIMVNKSAPKEYNDNKNTNSPRIHHNRYSIQ